MSAGDHDGSLQDGLLRLFVVGAPRSGTTLLQSLLGSHSALTTFTESHFFSRHYGLLPGTDRAVLRRDPLPRLREFLIENGEDESLAETVAAAASGSVLPGPLALARRSHAVGRALLAVLDRLAERRGASGWVEKTPRHLHFVELIEKLSEPVGRTCFVHLLRDGVEVVASLRAASQHWPESYDLETCVERWNEDVERSARRLESLSEREQHGGDEIVFYDELAADPEGVVRTLLARLDLGWEPEILERRAEVARSVVLDAEVWKQRAEQEIRVSDASSLGKQRLSESELELARRKLRLEPYERLRERHRQRHAPDGRPGSGQASGA